LRTMADDELFEIGSHTVTHIDLSRPWDDDRIRQELVDSKAALEKIVGRPIPRFAFPYGSLAHCPDPALRLPPEARYERIYSFFGGKNKVTPNEPPGYVLQRICPIYEDSEFVRACLENYRGRHTSLPFMSSGPRLSRDFHPTFF